MRLSACSSRRSRNSACRQSTVLLRDHGIPSPRRRADSMRLVRSFNTRTRLMSASSRESVFGSGFRSFGSSLKVSIRHWSFEFVRCHSCRPRSASNNGMASEPRMCRAKPAMVGLFTSFVTELAFFSLCPTIVVMLGRSMYWLVSGSFSGRAIQNSPSFSLRA